MEKHIEIELTWSELITGAMVGVMRRVQSLKRAYKGAQKRDLGAPQWQRDIEGALAELAVHRCLGIYWPCSLDWIRKGKTVAAPDMLEDIHIKGTAHANGRLIVRPEEDPKEGRYILVIHKNDRVKTIVGWINGADAASPDYLDNPNSAGEAYFVPQDHLNGFDKMNGHYICSA